jgi:hypothetical protein
MQPNLDFFSISPLKRVRGRSYSVFMLLAGWCCTSRMLMRPASAGHAASTTPKGG